MLCCLFPYPRGVVQLFNAVRTHQKKMEEEVKKAGGSERKRAKLMSSVSKRDFIDVLRNMEGAKGAKSPAGKATKSKQVGFICEKKNAYQVPSQCNDSVNELALHKSLAQMAVMF